MKEVKGHNRITSIILMLMLIIGMMATPVDATTYSKDEESTDAWYHDYIDTQEAWDLIDKVYPNKENRKKVIVATIDSGCNVLDSDLRANVDSLHSVQFSSLDGKYALPYYVANVMHGTKMAKIIAATSNNGIGKAGVAAGNNNDIVRLMALHVYSDAATQYGDAGHRFTTTKDIIDAMNYAAKNGAQVIHMCLGHDKHTRGADEHRFNDKALKKAVKRLVKKYDIVIVSSAGNTLSTKKWYPSDLSGVLGVINTKQYTDIKSKKVKVRSSSYGKRKAFSAPGDDSGTSGASAVAAGVVALVRYANPKLSAKQVSKVVESTATDLYKKGRDKRTGYGNVNAYAAVAKALKKAGYGGFPSHIKAAKCKEKVESIAITTKGRKKIKLSWEAVNSDSGYVNGYTILRSNKQNGKYKRIGTTKRTSYTDKKCKKGKKYFYKVHPFGTTYDGKVMKPTSAKQAIVVSAVAGKKTIDNSIEKEGNANDQS